MNKQKKDNKKNIKKYKKIGGAPGRYCVFRNGSSWIIFNNKIIRNERCNKCCTL